MEYLKKKVLVAVAIVFLILFVVLICVGQRKIGPAGLGLQLLGLAGILVLLYLYNRPYSK